MEKTLCCLALKDVVVREPGKQESKKNGSIQVIAWLGLVRKSRSVLR